MLKNTLTVLLILLFSAQPLLSEAGGVGAALSTATPRAEGVGSGRIYKKHSRTLLYIGIAGVVVGGVAAFLLLKGEPEAETKQKTAEYDTKFGAPPIPPGQ